VVFKPYPCNHFTHAGVDAALRLRAQGLAPADVTAIELSVNWCAASRTSAALRRSRTPSPPSGAWPPARARNSRPASRSTAAARQPLSDEELARKFHGNAVRSLPEERAAELAARTLLSSRSGRRGSHRAADLGGER
jgi:hypothetical protein